jgi:nitrous oxidase accessory protein NosD
MHHGRKLTNRIAQLAVVCNSANKHSFASKMLTAFWLTSALMFGMVNAAQAGDVNRITDCSAGISMEGQYKLVVDCDSGIDIRADNVELDLDGHTIAGSDCDPTTPPQTFGIRLTGRKNVRVFKGTLRNLDVGVAVDVSEHNQFTKLTVVENCYGSLLISSNENQFSFNNISRNIVAGVLVQGARKSANNPITFAKNNQITFNVIAENSATETSAGNGGVILGVNANGNVISFNAISGNLQSGVILVGPWANKNIVTNNIATQNSKNGIWVFCDNTENFLVSNIALGNATDLADANEACVKTEACVNTWKDNIFHTTDPSPSKCIR